VVIFSKNRTEASPPLTMIGICLLSSKEFKYLGVVFDRGLTWNAHTKYVVKRCKTRINFMKSIAGTSWGSLPDNMLILFKGLVRLVLEWRGLRVSLGLMQLNHTGKVEALRDVLPLELRFLYLNQKFLVYSYARKDDALRVRLKTLTDMGSGKNMRGYPWVELLGIYPGRSYTEYSFRVLMCVTKIVDNMRRAMIDFPDDFRPTVRCLSSISSEI
jgi:hypothetical protein